MDSIMNNTNVSIMTTIVRYSIISPPLINKEGKTLFERANRLPL